MLCRSSALLGRADCQYNAKIPDHYGVQLHFFHERAGKIRGDCASNGHNTAHAQPSVALDFMYLQMTFLNLMGRCTELEALLAVGYLKGVLQQAINVFKPAVSPSLPSPPPPSFLHC